MENRLYHIILSGAVVLAFIGFFVGTRSDGYDDVTEVGFQDFDANEKSADRGKGRPAPTYAELMHSPFSKNAEWRDNLSSQGDSDDIDGEIRDTLVYWEPVARKRAENRAYGGAPPRVPHPIQQRGDLACAACHQTGVRISGTAGSGMSHAFMANCTQCHVADSPDLPFAAEAPSTVSTVNTFSGMPEERRGPRAYAGAPPRIPHRTDMRDNCTGCHGENGRPGPMSHDYLPSCRQCHAASEGPPVAGDSPATVTKNNEFSGLSEDYAGGERAWEGSPPRIPHQLHMRQNCVSCHGAAGEAPIRTEHPWRQSCTQCHAPAGEYSFRPPSNLKPF